MVLFLLPLLGGHLRSSQQLHISRRRELQASTCYFCRCRHCQVHKDDQDNHCQEKLCSLHQEILQVSFPPEMGRH